MSPLVRPFLALALCGPALAQSNLFEADRPAGPPLNDPYRLPGRTGSALPGLEQLLADGSRAAAAEPTFEARNQRMADVLARMNAYLVVEPLVPADGQRTTVTSDVRRALRAAALATGERFSPAFDAEGRPIKSQEGAFKAAVSDASLVAWDSAQATARALGPSLPGGPDALRSVVERATAADVAEVVARRLGLRLSPAEGVALRSGLNQVVPEGDYFREPLSKVGVERGLKTPAELATLEVALRLANHTWQASQVHRAAVPGQEHRILADKQPNFRPFEGMMRTLFAQTFSDLTAKGVDTAKAERLAAARVVAEVTKDLLEMKKASARASARTPEELAKDKAALEQATARSWLGELGRMTVAQLLTEARRRGIEPGPGPHERAALIEAIAGKTGVALPGAKAAPAAPVAESRGLVERLTEGREKAAPEVERSKGRPRVRR